MVVLLYLKLLPWEFNYKNGGFESNNYIEVIESKNINESFSNSDIYNFINKYMHQFISRSSKQKEKYGIVKRLYLTCGKY